MSQKPYPTPAKLSIPIDAYKVSGYRFGDRVRSRIILWARHLGEDVLADPGTSIKAIGEGEVIWSEIRPGSKQRRNWGGIVIIGHTHVSTSEQFYSLYGHITDLQVKVGDVVQAGDLVGKVAAGHTPENGWWARPHLHFGIYTGPWMGQVLPGWAKVFEQRTKMHWWQAPQQFLRRYPK
ncbi:MAG: M23 family metallopeptidase [Candidatus Andersenbacteria bacterium]